MIRSIFNLMNNMEILRGCDLSRLAREKTGIVVFTHYKQRIPQAVELGRRWPNMPLHISGIDFDGSRESLEEMCGAPIGGLKYTCDNARHTFENGVLSTKWARNLGLQNIILVTGYHHMPRAYLELHRKYPQAKIYAYPVDEENIAYAALEPYKLLKRMLHIGNNIKDIKAFLARMTGKNKQFTNQDDRSPV